MSSNKKKKGILVKSFSSGKIEKIILSRYGSLFNKASAPSSTVIAPTAPAAVNITEEVVVLNPSAPSASSAVKNLLQLHDGLQVSSIYFDPIKMADQRPYLCKTNTRLVGYYKIVFFMQCVRVLWTLNPGKFKPGDLVHLNSNQAQQGGGGAGNGTSSYVLPYQPSPVTPLLLASSSEGEGKGVVVTSSLTGYERDFVLAFHNLSRPAGWRAINFPPGSDKKNRIVPLSQLLKDSSGITP